MPSSNCKHRLVYFCERHTLEIDITNFISLSDNIDATLSFQCFKRLSCDSSFCSDIRLLAICWIESVDPVAYFGLTNQIYSVLLTEFKEITEVQSTHLKMLLEGGETRTRRRNTFKCCKMLLEDEDDEKRPRDCKYPTPPCALAKTRDDRARLVSPNRQRFTHYKHVSYFFKKYSLSLYVYTWGLLGCFLGFWPLGQNAAGAILTAPIAFMRCIVDQQSDTY